MNLLSQERPLSFNTSLFDGVVNDAINRILVFSRLLRAWSDGTLCDALRRGRFV